MKNLSKCEGVDPPPRPLSDKDLVEISAQLEYEVFTANKVVGLYKRCIAKKFAEIRSKTESLTLFERLKTHTATTAEPKGLGGLAKEIESELREKKEAKGCTGFVTASSMIGPIDKKDDSKGTIKAFFKKEANSQKVHEISDSEDDGNEEPQLQKASFISCHELMSIRAQEAESDTSEMGKKRNGEKEGPERQGFSESSSQSEPTKVETPLPQNDETTHVNSKSVKNKTGEVEEENAFSDNEPANTNRVSEPLNENQKPPSEKELKRKYTSLFGSSSPVECDTLSAKKQKTHSGVKEKRRSDVTSTTPNHSRSKLKKQFVEKKKLSDVVVKHLMPFYKDNKISSKELFKQLARQTVHEILSHNAKMDEKDIQEGIRDMFETAGPTLSHPNDLPLFSIPLGVL